MRTFILVATMVALAPLAGAAPRQSQPPAPSQGQQRSVKVDLVIALDTSSSMDGLIDSARQKLWDAVNLLARAKPQPEVRVGLISYGNDGYDARTGWVRVDSALTTDLDHVYSKLFALRTNGGTEYVARALTTAVRDLNWDQSQSTLKIVFIAGNEPATQDPVIPVETAVRAAHERGILVNTIYCGGAGNGEALAWQKVARDGAGEFMAIEQNRVVSIAAPQDGELARLSGELNKTYVAYGARRAFHVTEQKAQDANSASLGAPAAASRAVAKAGGLYRNEEWDLVDAQGHDKKRVAALAVDELPDVMRAMSPAERDTFLRQKADERAHIQQKITDLAKQREAYLAAEQKKRAKDGPATFDDAMRNSIQREAESAGLKF